MKKTERIISIILLLIISMSNVATPVTYAAELGKFHFKPQSENPFIQKRITPAPKFLEPDHGSVLGTSTSILTVGSQELDLQGGNTGSAHQRIPISMQQLNKKVYQTSEDVTIAVVNPDNEFFTTSVQDSDGKGVNVPITESNNGTTTTVDLAPSNDIKPGLYKVMVTDQEHSTIEQDFTWGVLALNTDKSIYHTGETGDIAMAVLNDKGDMVCDADIALRIKNQSAGVDDTLSMKNAKITVNPQCQKHDYSLSPDYEAHYTFRAAGTYTMQLNATTGNGSHALTESINVKDATPFDIQRVSATRIYPPNTYPMIFNITANRDFSGTVTETVPNGFTITPATQSAAMPYTTMQTLYLNSTDPAAQLEQTLLATGESQLVMPFHGNFPITQGFGAASTDTTLLAFYSHFGLSGHDGIDFGVPIGTPLYAVDDGNILWAGPGDYGITIIIQHSWGKSYYGHLSNTSVTVGQHIVKGGEIGYSGNTGDGTGPHLHFGMKPNNADAQNGYFGKIDPTPYLQLGHVAQAISSTGAFSILAQSKSTPIGTNILGASDSATVSPTIAPTVSPSPTSGIAPTITATPTPTPQIGSESASSSGSIKPVSVTPTSTPTPAAQPETSLPTLPGANENFTVLSKEIKINEALANNALTQSVKVITWHVTLKKGESTSLGYQYQTPKASPEFYLLGPAKFYESGTNKVVFQEERQWQIAADDVGVDWFTDTTGRYPLNGYSWKNRRKITIDHTKTSNALYSSRPTPFFIEPGSDATQDTSLYNATDSFNTGGITSDSSIKNTGTRSLKLTDTASANPGLAAPLGSVGGTAGRVSAYVYFDNFPNTGINHFLNLYSSTNTYLATPVQLTTADKLECTNGTTNGTTTFTTGQWYRISFGYTVSSNTITYNVYLNGSLEISCGTETMAATAAPSFLLLGSDVNTETTHFDDIYSDNGSDKSDTGDIHITNKRPFANGTSNQFTTQIGSGGSGYGSGHASQVNEQPLNTSNGWSISTTTQKTEEYNVEANTAGDIDVSKSTLIADCGWIDAAESTTANSPVSHIIVNGTTSAVTLTTSAAGYQQCANANAYPSGSGTDIGIDGQYTATPGTYSLYEAGMLIAYIPSTTATYNTLTPTFMDSGGDATDSNGGSNFTTSTGGFWQSTFIGAGSTLTTDCTISHTGPCSVKAFSGGNPGTKAAAITPSFSNTASGRVSGYYYFDSLPSASNALVFLALQTAGNANVVTVEIDGASSGKLKFGSVAGAVGQTVIQQNKWYRVSLSYSITSATVNHFIVYLNGKKDIDLVNTNLGTATTGDHLRIGNLDNQDANTTMHFDDIYSDNGSDLSDTGDVRVTAKLPIANGGSNGYTANGSAAGTTCASGTHCAYVNERPLSTSNNLSSTTANARENFTIQSATQGDVDVSNAGVIANEAWVYAKNSGACSGLITNNAVDSSISLTTADTMFTAIATNANFFAGNQGVGIQNCSSGTVTLEEAGMLVAYTPNSPANSLTNFPVLVSLSSDTDLSNNAQASGNDIVFTDSTGRNLLNYEIESYSSGTLNAWVQIPTLSTATDTIIYMYYGNPAATSQANASATWGNSYVSVYHLGETSGTSVKDSTSDNYTGTAVRDTTNTKTTGLIDGAQNLNGTSDGIDIGDQPFLDFGSGSFTVSVWINKTTDAGTSDMPWWKGGSSAATQGYDFETGSSSPWHGHISDGTTSLSVTYTKTEGGVWQNLVMVADRFTNNLIPYQNGTEGTTTSISGEGGVTSTRHASIGYDVGSNSFFFQGKIDEVEVSTAALSPGWILTEYNNQNSPGTFSPVSASVETVISGPTLSQLMRHGQYFNSQGIIQPFTF